MSEGHVATSKKTDAYTLLSSDMLRLMFVLEGCCSRADLDTRMDWGHKGRVLGLEKQSR